MQAKQELGNYIVVKKDFYEDVKFSVDELANKLYKEINEICGNGSIKKEDCLYIATLVESKLKTLGFKRITDSLIREITANILEENNLEGFARIFSSIRLSYYEIVRTDMHSGSESNENANLQPNPETFHKKKADLISKEAYLRSLPSDLANAHISGDLHIHDLEYLGTRPFCSDHDLRFYFYHGFMPDGTGKHTSVAKPATHPEVALLHACKVLGSAQTNFAGGQGFFNFTVFMSPYLKDLEEKRIRQIAQMFLYEMTQLYVARGGQPVFSSIQIESGVPKLWRDAPAVYKGKVDPNLRYGDLEDTVNAFANALLDEYIKGDARGKMFNFPKPEVSIRERYYKDFEETMLKASQLSLKFGSTYYDNYIPEYRGGEDSVACYQCCAYSFADNHDTDPDFDDKIMFKDSKHFSMGSLQVITLNIPRYAYESKGDYAKFYELLKLNMDKAKRLLDIKRKIVANSFEKGLMPFASQRFDGSPPAVDLSNYVSNIGFVGINNAVQYLTGYQMHESPIALKYAIRIVMDMMRIVKSYGDKYTVSRTPAETVAHRFALLDYKKYGNNVKDYIRGNFNDLDTLYYDNGAHVNVSAPIPLATKLSIEEKFFPILKGGDIFHSWIYDANGSIEALHKLNKAIAHTQVGYWAHTKDLSYCSSCSQIFSGLQGKCPICGDTKINRYSRITGYYQEVGGWNKAKQQELKDRYRIRIGE